jgi:dihydroorotase
MKTLLKNAEVDNEIVNILIDDKFISYIGKRKFVYSDYDEKLDLKGCVVIPGMIDPHTHIRDLDFAYKEDWRSAGYSALKGGVTTIIDMPNTKPPTINYNNLLLKREKAKLCPVNHSYHMGANEENLKDIVEVLSTEPDYIAGIKIFLSASSSNEILKDNEAIKNIFKLGRKYGKPILVHTELAECLNKWKNKYNSDKYNDVLYHNEIRNRECSIKGTELVLKLCREIGNKLYIAHTTTKEEIELIKEYKHKYSLPVYCEITPHHLLLNEAIIENSANFAKVNPPLRTKKDNIALWKGIKDGTVDIIGTDHAPHLREEKERPYIESPSGFPGMETVLPLFINEVNKEKISLNKLISLTSGNTAKIFKIDKRGLLKEGYYADLTVIDMDKEWIINSSDFLTKAKYSPFEGFKVKGKIIYTIINGKCLYKDGNIDDKSYGEEIIYE